MTELEKVRISTIRTDAQVRALPDDELLLLHFRLHQLYGAARARGEATEYPYVNVHVWVVEEMHRRGMHHTMQDDLDQQSLAITKVRQPLKSPGGKTRLVRKLLMRIPQHTTYVEPYAGGAALFWAKKPSRVEVLNDTNRDIIDLYRFLKNASDAELEAFSRLDWKASEETYERLVSQRPAKLFDRAYRTWYTSRFGYRGVHSQRGGYLHADAGQVADVTIDRLHALRDRLQHATLRNEDALVIIREYDSPETFFYIDPPYLNTDPGYKDLPPIEHYIALGKILRHIRGLVLLSSNNETLKAIDLPSHWTVTRVKTTYTMPGEKLKRFEYIAQNYHIAKSTEILDWLDDQLEDAEDVVLVPAYVSLVGSATQEDDPADIDVLIREDEEHLSKSWRESVMLLVRHLLDPAKEHGRKIHVMGNPQGPHLPAGRGYIPLFDLVLRPRREAELVTKVADDLDGDDVGKGLRQPLMSPGGKRRVARKLLAMMPQHKVYVEPYAGGAALFWTKEPSEVEVLNDLNGDIVALYRFLKNASDEELKAFTQRDWEGKESLFERLLASKPTKLADRAYRTWYLSRFGYLGVHSRTGSFRHADAGAIANVTFDRLSSLRERLRNVKIEQDDALAIIRRYDSPETFFYIDPPYLGADAGYRDMPEPEHFQQLGALLRSLKGKALISGNTQTIKALHLPGNWDIQRIGVPYSMNRFDEEAQQRRFELVARNYRIAKSAPAMPDWERWLDEAPEGRRVDLGPGEDGSPEGFEPLGRPYDLNETWPLEPASIAVIRANHVFEHLEEPAHAMGEAWRVLVPGGLLIVTVPDVSSPGAVAHPEHRSLWNADSFLFWTNPELLQTVEQRVPQAFELLHLEVREEDGRRYVDAVLRKPDDGIQKRALEPVTAFTPPKPAMKGRTHTDAFSPDEIWPWVERHVEAGVVAEPKYNGFRAIVQHRHPRLSIRFEDSQQERAPKLLAADRRLEVLHDLPSCILDCDIGVVEGGERWSRPRLMTLTADRPELPEGAHIAITAFDVLYWDGESVNERPFQERRALLERVAPVLRKHGIDIPPEMPVRTKQDLERAWRSARFGLADRSEGLVLKALDWVYRPGPATDGMAKIKHALEVKAIVLEVKRTANGAYNFRGGLVPGTMAGELDNLVEFRGKTYVDLGFSYNAPFAAEPGDIVTFQVEEIAWDQPDRRLNWLGAAPLDVDKERTEPYAAAQVIDMARRARVLQEVPVAKAAEPSGEGGETRGEAALKNWEEHWYEAMPTSGKALPFILHAHWRGLTEDEAALSMDELLQTENSLHFDLRLGTDRFDGWWGISLFAGTTEENRDELRILKMMRDPEERLESAPKQFGPAPWLKVGLRAPLVVEPGGVGSTSRAWSKFFAIDRGTWRLGMARVHGVEIWLDGQHLKGRFVWQYAPVDGDGRRRTWLFTRPADQRPYAEVHDLDEVVRELAEKGQHWLFWPKDPENLAKGLQQIDVQRMVRELRKYVVIKREEEQRYTLGVAYPAGRVDAHGDYTTPEELEKAAWEFVRRIQKGQASVGLMHRAGTGGAGTVVESYIYRGPDWTIGDQTVRAGDWLLGVIWNEQAWQLIKEGRITGYSIQGMARKVPQ